MKKIRGFSPIIIIGFLLFLLNAYMFNGLQIVFSSAVLGAAWLLPVGIFVLFTYSMLRLPTKGINLSIKISLHTLLIYFCSALVFCLILLANDVYRILIALVNSLLQGEFKLPETSKYTIYIASLLFIATVIVFIYGMIVGKYKYKIIKHTLVFDNLPNAFDGFKIVQISDVHAGSLKRPKAVQKGIDLIKAQKADLFVFTGDLVNNKAEEIVPYINHFSQISAPYGQFSILGNHDYGDYIKWNSETEKRENLETLKQHHASIGFKLLLDEHVKLEKSGAHLILAGIENWGLGFGERGNLAKALQGTSLSEFKILLSHDPSHWEEQVKNFPSKINLTLAGHTHGMQFGIEAFGIKWSPVQFRYKHWAGIKAENDRVLNVNRGFGFIGFSGRIGIWPEISVIELKKRK